MPPPSSEGLPAAVTPGTGGGVAGTVHVGIDLAWGTTARTGVAAVDASGRLLGSATVVSDEELDAWLGDLPGPIGVVAVDAPLEVPNATGARGAERELTSAYGRYGCGCHVANRSRPWFDPPRGEVLAARHGWSLEPTAVGAGAPVAVEVYPHAALIGLFALGRVLPYKAKARRDLATRQEAFARLVALLESVPELGLLAGPGRADWAEQVAAVRAATRPVDLERVEDRIDAVLCAHLAWRWATDPASLHVYGGPGLGRVVAPPRPTHARG